MRVYSEILYFFDALKRDSSTHRPIGNARQLLALACEGFPVDPMVFQRGSDGKVVSSSLSDGIGCPPAVAIGEGDGYISLLGIGPLGAELIAGNAEIIGTALAQKLKQPYRFRRASGDCDISGSHTAIYRIPRMSVFSPGKLGRKRARGYLDGDRYTMESVSPVIRQRIINGILGQAQYLDKTCGGLRESAIGSDDMLDIRILDGGVTIAPVKGGLYALIATNLVFGMSMDLRGPWMAAGMRSYGLGRIYKGGI